MKVWIALTAMLLLATIVAACAGNQWASPADLLRAIDGDQALRSRLLVDWRLPRVVAAAFVGALLGLGGTIYQGV
ncbi:MAG: iron chelate uptake ABC transporter family permease subunit, partial [Rhodospirillaceae bacterium]